MAWIESCQTSHNESIADLQVEIKKIKTKFKSEKNDLSKLLKF